MFIYSFSLELTGQTWAKCLREELCVQGGGGNKEGGGNSEGVGHRKVMGTGR